MPPSDAGVPQSHSALAAPIANRGYPHGRMRINVGGKVFETTWGGSLLGQMSRRGDGAPPTFIDRDPDLFSVLLSVIRTGNLPAGAEELAADEIIEEARFYGVEEILKSAVAPPTLDGIDAEMVGAVRPNGRELPSVLAGGPDGSVWVSHGNKITAYDWALRRRATMVTLLGRHDCLHRISPTHAVGGCVDCPGLPVYDVVGGRQEKTIVWLDPADPRIYDATAHAVCSSPDHVFASFESRRGENAILAVDRHTLQIVSEIGRETGTSARLTAARKLEWVPRHSLLLASAVRGGAFGYCGYMRLWDPRCRTVLWERNEPSYGGGCFGDVAASEARSAVFKVDIGSGDVAMADLRRLDLEDPWMVLRDPNPALAKGEGGAENRLLSHDEQIFCSRGGDVEVWSNPPSSSPEGHLTTFFRRNFMGQAGQGKVWQMEAGGNRIFIGREGAPEIEIWESRRRMRKQRVAQIHPL